MAIAILLNSLK